MGLQAKNKVDAAFSMSSMTDIIFLLLIFFMLTSTMVTTNALDLNLPKAKGKTENTNNIAVNIKKDLQFFIDKEPVNEADLETTLLQMMGGDETKAIILRAEQGVPIEKAVTVMDIANRNKLKIVLAVDPK